MSGGTMREIKVFPEIKAGRFTEIFMLFNFYRLYDLECINSSCAYVQSCREAQQNSINLQ